jgi:5-formaminoimidazole-4-carboxamide-1-(beta)-D-ribofuranosyl 5'-monophosphate synthetase
VLKGAKDEGFETMLLCTPDRKSTYERFPVVDEYFMIDDYKDLARPEIQNELLEKDVVLIPNGSFVEYIGAKAVMDFKVPLFGNKNVLEWESDRHKAHEWFEKAGIHVPITFKDPSEIDRLVLVKYPGAKGGKGYVLVESEEDFKKQIGEFDAENMFIQEYILGTRFYPSYFYSPLNKENELTGIDIRYETNADGLPRMPTAVYMPPTYVVTGNTPVVIRESLLPRLYKMADDLVSTSKELFSPGIIGPYCMEMVVTDKLEMVVFEISARIVAGTNIWEPGSPYMDWKYGKPLSMGRRIAMELKKAEKGGSLGELLS